MKSLRKEIYQISRNILNENPLDISDIELSAIITHSILNKGYYEHGYEYLNLTKNIYGEYCLGHKKLSEVYGYTNQTVNATLICFNDKDKELFNSEATDLDLEEVVLTKKELEYLKDLKNILKNDPENLYNKIDNINSIENRKELFETSLNKIFADKDNKFIDLLKAIIPNRFSEEEYEILIKKYKLKDYSRILPNEQISISDCNPLFNDIMNYQKLKIVEKLFYNNYNEEVIESELEQMIGIDKKEFNKFRNSIKYKGSILEIVDIFKNENLKIEDKIIKTCFMFKKFKLLISDFIEKIDKIEKKLTIEDIKDKYKKEINIAENYIYKKYPDLLLKISDIKLNVNEINTGESLDNKSYLSYYIKNPNLTDLHINNGNYSSYESCVIAGITEPGYSHGGFYGYNNSNVNEHYIELRNSIEVVGLLNLKKNRKFQSRLSYEELENVNCYKIYSVNLLTREDLDLNVFKLMMKNIIEEIKDKEIIIVHDFINAAQNSKIRRSKLINLVNDLEKENKNIIFINEYPSSEERILLDLKSQLIDMINTKEIDFKTAVEVNKNLVLENKEVIKLNQLNTYVKSEHALNCIKSIMNDLNIKNTKKININKIKV